MDHSAPDDAALDHMLWLLLAVALAAAAVPLFGAAFVYRWFHSLRIAALVLAGLGAVAVPVLLLWRAPRPVPNEIMRGALPSVGLWSVCGAAAVLALLAVALTAQTVNPVLLLRARHVLVLPAGALAVIAALIVAAARAHARRQPGRAAAIAWGAVAVAWLDVAAAVIVLAVIGGE